MYGGFAEPVVAAPSLLVVFDDDAFDADVRQHLKYQVAFSLCESLVSHSPPLHGCYN